ncbi:MAG TPA: AzlC family ABC transporter permease [Azospirillaceae bacterium]|nr:AzlC family ABC transporter permease [Azospirillaceae bacterium]
MAAGADPGRAACVRAALGEAFGIPGLVLGASFLGFGSLVRESGMSLWAGLATSLTSWALPGQVAMVELWAAGSSLVAIVLAVCLTNARLMPMTVVLLPWLGRPGAPRWRLYVAAQFVAVTSWANSMQRLPDVPEPHRLAWFAVFAGGLFGVSVAATAAGYALAGLVPKAVTLALVFLNPVYFMLIFVTDLRNRAKSLALAAGAVLGPLFHLVHPDWGLLATGLAAGTAAFLADRAWRRREAHRG